MCGFARLFGSYLIVSRTQVTTITKTHGNIVNDDEKETTTIQWSYSWFAVRFKHPEFFNLNIFSGYLTSNQNTFAVYFASDSMMHFFFLFFFILFKKINNKQLFFLAVYNNVSRFSLVGHSKIDVKLTRKLEIIE